MKKGRIEKATSLSIHDFNSPVLVYSNKTKKIVDWNIAACKAVGYAFTSHPALSELNHFMTSVKHETGHITLLTKRRKEKKFRVTQKLKLRYDNELCWAEWLEEVTLRNSASDELNVKLIESLRNITDGFFAVDKKLTVIFTNQVFEKLANIPASKMVGHKLTELFEGFDKSPLYLEYRKSLKTGRAFTTERFNPHNPKQIFEISGYPTQNGLLIYYRDVSSRPTHISKASDLMLRLKKFEKALDHSSLVIRTDAHGNFTFANKNFERRYGYSFTELKGKNFDILNSDQHPKEYLAEMWNTLSEGNSWHGELNCRAKNGTHFWNDVNAMPLTDAKGKVRKFLFLINDITDIKEAQQKAKESEDLLNRLSANVPGMIYNFYLTSPTEGVFPFVSKGSERLFGIPPEEIMKDAGVIFSLLHPEDYHAVMHSIQEAYYTNEPWLSEFRVVLPGNTVKWISGESKPYNEKNGMHYWYGFMYDVTEKKLAEQKIAESELENRLIVENSGEGILLGYIDGSIYKANPAACEIFGMTEQEIIHAGRTGLVDQNDPELKRLLKERIEKGTASGQYKMKRKDGTIFLADVTSTVFTSPLGRQSTTTIFKDISERKKNELALAESEQKYRLLADNMQDLVCLHDPDGTYRYVSPSVKHILGYHPDEMIGKDPYSFFHPDDLLHIREKCHEKVIEGNTLTQCVYRIRKKNGEYIWFETITNAITNEQGQPVSLQTSSRDITERKKAEEVRNELMDRFERIADHVPGFIYQYRLRSDGSSQFPYASKGIKAIYGLTPQEAAADASKVFSAISPDDQEHVGATIQQSANTLTDWRDSYRVILPNGKYIWVEGYSTPQKEDDGSIIWNGYITDVTEKKKNEQTLQESTARLRAFFDFTSDSVILIDRNYAILDFNRIAAVNAEEVFSKNLQKGQSILDYTTAETRANFIENYQKALSGETCHREFELKVPTYETTWWHFKHSPIINDSGDIIGVGFSSMNITARKKAELELISSEERFRKLTQELPIGVLLQGLHDEVLYSNQALQNILGLTEEQISDKSKYEPEWRMIHEDGSPFTHEDRPSVKAIQTGKPIMNIPVGVYRPKTRDWVWLLKSATPLTDKNGNVVQVIISYFDVTKERQNLRELEKLSLIARHTDNVIVITDASKKIEWVNHAFEELTGYTMQEALGKSPRELLQGPETSEVTNQYVREKLNAKEPVHFEIINYTRQKEKYWLEVEIQPVFNDQGELINFIAIELNISQRKEAEAKLRQQAEEIRMKNEQLLSISENIPGGAIYQFLMTPEGNFSFPFISDGIEKLVGILPQVLRQDGNYILSIIHPDDMQPFQEAIIQSAKHLTNFDKTARFRNNAGEYRWITGYSKPTRLEDGSVLWNGILFDETEITKAQQKIAENEERLRTITDNLTAGVIYQLLADENGKALCFPYISANAINLFGKSAEEIMADVSVTFSMVNPAHIKLMMEAAEESRINLTPFDLQYEMILSDTKSIWVHTRATPRRLDNGYTLWDGLSVNITAEKQLELAIQESESRLKSMFENMSNGVLVVDLNNTITYANKRAAEILSITREELENNRVGSGLWRNVDEEGEIIPLEELPVKIALTQMRAVSNIEHGIIDRNGKSKWLTVSAAPLFDQNHQLKGVVASFIDITSRKEAEKDLIQKNKQVEIAAMLANMGEWELNLDTNTPHWSDEVCRIHEVPYGFVPDLQKAISFYTPESIDQITNAVKKCIETGESYDLELEIITAKGNRRNIRTIGLREISPGKPKKLFGIFQDITAQKESARELFESKKYFESLVNSQSSFLIRTDLAGNYTYANPAYFKKFGKNEQELIGRNSLEDIMDADRAVCVKTVESCFANPGKVFTVALRKANPTGKGFFWTEWEFVALQNSEGEVTGMQCVGLDVTDRITSQLKLVGSLREKEMLIKEIHHRIKNNLQLISSILYLKSDSFDSKDMRDFLSAMREKIKSISLIHERLLQTGMVDILNASEYLQSLVSDIRKGFYRKDANINIETNLESIEVPSDVAMYCGLIVNELVTNSMKYAFPDFQAGLIKIALSRGTGGEVILSIKDNGIGLPEGVSVGTTGSFGMQLVNVFAKQLKATVEIIRTNGTEFIIRFNL